LFAKHKTEKYFVPTSNVHNEEINKLFDKHGVVHSQAEMYRTVSTDIDADYIKSFDMLIFFSPHGIESLKKNVPDYVQGEQKIACFGNVTAKCIQENGLRLDLEAPSATATNMPAALDAFLTANNK
jgi:uroporphyrinogen-III synthase